METTLHRVMAAAVAVSAVSCAPTAWAADPTPHPDRTGFGLHSTVSLSIDRAAFAGALGGRYAFTEHWLVGIDAEYNPWFSFEAGRASRGAFNGYATGIYRHHVTERLALRVTAHIGFSVLLVDLVGAPAGSVGPFVGGSLLGVSYDVGHHVYLIADPAQVVLPVPQIRGAPFTYPQYRLTVGVQYGG